MMKKKIKKMLLPALAMLMIGGGMKGGEAFKPDPAIKRANSIKFPDPYVMDFGVDKKLIGKIDVSLSQDFAPAYPRINVTFLDSSTPFEYMDERRFLTYESFLGKDPNAYSGFDYFAMIPDDPGEDMNEDWKQTDMYPMVGNVGVLNKNVQMETKYHDFENASYSSLQGGVWYYCFKISDFVENYGDDEVSAGLCQINGLDSNYLYSSSDFNFTTFADQVDSIKEVINNCDISIVAYNDPNQILDGKSQDLYYYVPNVPTMADILGGITAKDLFGVDCTVECSDIERGKYTGKIGLSAVKITATDTYGQTATATLNIHIIDNGKPVIQLATGKNLSFVADQGSLKVSELPSYFSITDVGTNYGGTLGAVTYTYDGAAFTDQTFTSANFGQHTIAVKVADSSGNSTTQSFALTVTDGTAPVITRRDSSQMSSVIKIGVSRTFSLTKAEFLQIFKATDNVDGDLSASLAIDGTFIGNKVGSYSVKIKVADKSGNTGSATASVQVIADLPPVFILSDTLVLATVEQTLTTADMTSIVTNGILSNQTVSACSVNLGTYVGNENVPGDYTITYQATVAGTKAKRNENSSNDVVGSFTLRVSDTAVKDDSEKTGWWDNFCKGWNEFWQKLGNWFRGVFTKFKFDCYLTDEEWEMRFPKKDTEDKTDTSVSA